jgi:arylsulfatase A-like enzyme
MPLLIRNPNVAPKTITRQVSMLDITPTLAELMTLKSDGDVDGHTLKPLMEQGDKAEIGQPDAALYAYEWYNGSWFGIRAIRTPEFKFVWNPGDNRDEFYDLVNDPLEMKNLIKDKSYKKQKAEMVTLLKAELARVEDPSLKMLNHHAKAYLEDKVTKQAH